MTGKNALNHMVPARVFPRVRNHAELKSVKDPPLRPNPNGYSLMSAPTKRSRKAVLKNCTTNVTVVVYDSLIVSVLKPTQFTSMIQIVLKTKLMPVRT